MFTWLLLEIALWLMTGVALIFQRTVTEFVVVLASATVAAAVLTLVLKPWAA
jgi:hypothetical protein